MDIEPQGQATARPTWLTTMCRGRSVCKTSAFRWHSLVGWRCEFFVFVLENPLMVCFARLKENDRESAPDYFEALGAED